MLLLQQQQQQQQPDVAMRALAHPSSFTCPAPISPPLDASLGAAERALQLLAETPPRYAQACFITCLRQACVLAVACTVLSCGTSPKYGMSWTPLKGAHGSERG